MGSFTDFTENAALNHIVGNTVYTPAATLYIGLSTADPLDTAAGLAEPSVGSYVRQPISFNAAAARAVVQSNVVNFPTASADWGLITHYGIFTAAEGGNLLASGSLGTPRNVSSGKTLSIASGQVQISILTGAWSTYLANKILDLIFRNQAFTPPTIYVGLVETTEITDAHTGSNVDELDMAGYARKAHAAWDVSTAGATENTGIIDFGALTGTGETITAAFAADALTGGNILFYSNSPNLVVDPDDVVQFADGAFDVTLS